MGTFGGTIASLDAARFVGRLAELERLEELLDSGPHVVFVHGPGGVGKSTLLRELCRRASRRGFTV
ncbi:MAG: ATP-binding protein, partial [Solirubrobacteraceae bacterium]